jgi:hypothetical protein
MSTDGEGASWLNALKAKAVVRVGNPVMLTPSMEARVQARGRRRQHELEYPGARLRAENRATKLLQGCGPIVFQKGNVRILFFSLNTTGLEGIRGLYGRRSDSSNQIMEEALEETAKENAAMSVRFTTLEVAALRATARALGR